VGPLRDLTVRYLPGAISDIEGIRVFLTERNPAVAARVLAAVRTAIDHLGRNPGLGHSGIVADALEWVVARTPYIVLYEVDRVRHELVVLAVFHGAQDR
jgi:toxin ParE1/3/4